MASHPVPAAYRILFTFIDPAFCLLGLVSHMFNRDQTMTGYSPAYAGPPSVALVHLLDSTAGFFAMLAALEAVLLRVRGRDVTVWRVVQGSASLLDWFMGIEFAVVSLIVRWSTTGASASLFLECATVRWVRWEGVGTRKSECPSGDTFEATDEG